MKLGILVNSDKNPDKVAGITKAAVERGHEVIIFTMDEGTRLFEDPRFSGLSGLRGVRMSFCGHNAAATGLDVASIPNAVVRGSQFDNASMNHVADRVIVL